MASLLCLVTAPQAAEHDAGTHGNTAERHGRIVAATAAIIAFCDVTLDNPEHYLPTAARAQIKANREDSQ